MTCDRAEEFGECSSARPGKAEFEDEKYGHYWTRAMSLPLINERRYAIPGMSNKTRYEYDDCSPTTLHGSTISDLVDPL